MSNFPSAEATAMRLAETGLVWGLKSSFLAYLGRQPDSRSTISGGAGLTPSGEYYFPLGDDSGFDRATGRGVIKFSGDVRFSAHHGLMFVMVADPWLTFDEEAAVLTVVDSSVQPPGRLPLVVTDAIRPTTSGSVMRWSALPTRLATEGVPVFNEVYATGTSFDALHVRIPES